MHRFEEKSHVEMYGRLLNLAATSLAEVWFGLVYNLFY